MHAPGLASRGFCVWYGGEAERHVEHRVPGTARRPPVGPQGRRRRSRALRPPPRRRARPHGRGEGPAATRSCRSSAGPATPASAATTTSPASVRSPTTRPACRSATTSGSGTRTGRTLSAVLDDITWPGKIPYYALSTGTTSGRDQVHPGLAGDGAVEPEDGVHDDRPLPPRQSRRRSSSPASSSSSAAAPTFASRPTAASRATSAASRCSEHRATPRPTTSSRRRSRRSSPTGRRRSPASPSGAPASGSPPSAASRRGCSSSSTG